MKQFNAIVQTPKLETKNVIIFKTKVTTKIETKQ